MDDFLFSSISIFEPSTYPAIGIALIPDCLIHPNLADNNEYMTLPHSALLIEYTTRIKKKLPERMDLDRVPVDIRIVPSFESFQQVKDVVMEFLLKAKN